MATARWNVGVTTAARESRDYLPATLLAIEAAGWPDPLVLAEPSAPVPAAYRASRSKEPPGPWPNFCRGLRELVAADPKATTVIFQDDVDVARNLRPWLETQLWPFDELPGVLSLYTAGGVWRGRAPGWFKLEPDLLPRRAWGALAIVLPAESARLLLNDLPGRGSLRMTDVLLAKWCKRAGLSWIQHAPGFCEHVGQESTTRRDWPEWAARRAGEWVRDAATVTSRKPLAE